LRWKPRTAPSGHARADPAPAISGGGGARSRAAGWPRVPLNVRRHAMGGGDFAPPPRTQATISSFNVANEFENLHRVRTELLGELILDWLGSCHEARLVDVFDNLDAHGLELRGRIRLQLESVCRIFPDDLVGSGLYPLLFLRAEALPGFIADPDAVVVRLMLG